LKFMPIQSIMVDSEAKTNEAASCATSGVETLSEIWTSRDNHTFSFSLNADPGRPQRFKKCHFNYFIKGYISVNLSGRDWVANGHVESGPGPGTQHSNFNSRISFHLRLNPIPGES
jgi:hypothetical protein